MRFNDPTADDITGWKNRLPDRSLHLIEAVDGDDCYCFIMSGPNRDEYKKFLDDVSTANEQKEEKVKLDKLRLAVEHAALAQLRFPDRDECRRIFDSKPAFVINFAEEIHKAAGASVEVRSKKL
jgi:hypothetical protein